MENLAVGYNLKLKKDIEPEYMEQNNRSARENMDFVRSKIEEWEKKGRLHKVEKRPACVNPLSVAEKFSPEENAVKKRLVMDCSRYVNLLVEKETVRPDDLSYFEPLIEEEAYISTFDLASMYHHLELSEEAKQYFGFSVPDPITGEAVFYVMDRMPFGFAPAMSVMADLLNPVLNFLRGKGIRIGCFVDDGAIVNKNPKVAFEEALFCRQIIQCAGWNIAWDKTQVIPDQVVKYQGFVIDTIRGEFRLTEVKRRYIIEKLENVLKLSYAQAMPAKELASVLGKVLACRRSHGQSVQVALRYTQNLLGRAVMHRGPEYEPDWSVKVCLNEQSRREIKYVQGQFESRNGNPFSLRKKFEVLNRNGELFYTDEASQLGQTEYQVLASDASDKIAFIYETGQFRLVENFFFNESESAVSSGHRELLAIVKTLETMKDYFKESEKRIYWITDSANVFYFMKRGSVKELIQADILRIKEMEAELGIHLTVIWAPRETETIAWADAGSRMHKSTDEWSVDRNTYFKIVKCLGLEPTVDGFATRINTRCERFFSKFPQLYAQGVDFFAQRLSKDEVYWLCPPPSLVARVVRHLESQEKGIVAYLSFPEWPASNYWPLLVRENKFMSKVVASFYTRPNYVAHNWEPNVFRGFRKFRFITVLMVWNDRVNSVKYVSV